MINKNNFRFLFELIKLGFKKYKILYFLTVLSMLSIILETLAMSIMGSLSGRRFIAFDSSLKSLDPNFLFILVIIFFVIRFLVMYYTEKKYTYIARLFQTYLSTRTLEKIFNERLKKIEEKEIGFFISMAGDEASRSSEILNSFMRILNALFIGALYFVMLLYFDLNFVYILLAFFVINLFVVKMVMQKLVRLGNDSVTLGRNATSIFLDSLNSLRTVKSFGMNKFVHGQYFENMDKYQMTNYRIFSLSLFNKLFPLIVLFILFDGYIAFDYLTSHQLSVVYLLTLFFILMRFLTIVGELLQTSSTVFSNLKLTNDIVSFSKDIEPDKTEKSLGVIELISMKDVSFGHTNNKAIFTEINLTFHKGKSYMIVGKTGGGKSTLLDLIMDFNSPTSGSIYVNNVNTRDIDEKSFTNKILYVSQETMVFNNTIRHNLELDKKYSDEKIKHYLTVAELTSTVENFEGNLNHLLNYRGTNISGGQKQRLNIARALLREPDVLILDESVNALDSETRLKVICNIINEYKNKIVILVAHDKDIIDMVDEVIDLDKLKSNGSK